jgi:hypothetical protein
VERPAPPARPPMLMTTDDYRLYGKRAGHGRERRGTQRKPTFPASLCAPCGKDLWVRIYPGDEFPEEKAVILQRYHGLIATAESCNSEQSALRLGHDHHRSVAIHGVPGGGEVPLPSLWLCRLLAGGG